MENLDRWRCFPHPPSLHPFLPPSLSPSLPPSPPSLFLSPPLPSLASFHIWRFAWTRCRLVAAWTRFLRIALPGLQACRLDAVWTWCSRIRHLRFCVWYVRFCRLYSLDAGTRRLWGAERIPNCVVNSKFSSLGWCCVWTLFISNWIVTWIVTEDFLDKAHW